MASTILLSLLVRISNRRSISQIAACFTRGTLALLNLFPIALIDAVNARLHHAFRAPSRTIYLDQIG
jgi:hypothetical protein